MRRQCELEMPMRARPPDRRRESVVGVGDSRGDAGDECFLATGCSLFPGSRLGVGVEIRINGVVHTNSVLGDGAVVPIAWVAGGDPAQVFAPGRHDGIWAVQRGLDFGATVYGDAAGTSTRERMARQSAWFGAHRHDVDRTDRGQGTMGRTTDSTHPRGTT